jgi:hypothetical protein
MSVLARQPEVRIHVEGSVSGQIAVGDNILQIGSIHGGIVNILAPGERPIPRPRPTPINARPRAFRELVGREQEVGIAVSVLRSAQPVEIYGPAGLGKTSLLRHLSHHQVAEEFIDGVVYARALQKTADDTIQEIFQAFYECDVPYKPTDVQFRLQVGDKHALILLDDVDWGREEVERLLDVAPGCTFLLGSPRRQVWEEGRPIALRGLSEEAALALAEQRLGRPFSPEELPLARSLCGALEGHPLRLVQAIGLVQEGSKTLRETVASLRSEAPPRALARRALAACSPPERRVLAMLGALDGMPIHVPHLGTLAKLDEPEEVLTALRTRGLVLAEGSRCRLAGTLLKSLPKSWDLQLCCKQALVFYVRWAERHQVRGDYRRIAEEADVLLFLMKWAGGAGRWREMLRLGRAMEDALALSGRWGGWKQVLELEVRAAVALGDQAAEARALHQLGTRDLCLGQHQAARGFLASALTMREALGDTAGARVTRHNLGLLPKGAPPHGDAGPSRRTKFGRGVVMSVIGVLVILTGGRIGRDAWTVAGLRSLELRPGQIVGGASTQGLVALDGPAASGAEVALSSDRPDLVTVPESVLILAGERAGKFTVKTKSARAPVDVMIRASRNGIERITALKLGPEQNLGGPQGPRPDRRAEGLAARGPAGQPGGQNQQGDQPRPRPADDRYDRNSDPQDQNTPPQGNGPGNNGGPPQGNGPVNGDGADPGNGPVNGGGPDQGNGPVSGGPIQVTDSGGGETDPGNGPVSGSGTIQLTGAVSGVPTQVSGPGVNSESNGPPYPPVPTDDPIPVVTGGPYPPPVILIPSVTNNGWPRRKPRSGPSPGSTSQPTPGGPTPPPRGGPTPPSPGGPTPPVSNDPKPSSYTDHGNGPGGPSYPSTGGPGGPNTSSQPKTGQTNGGSGNPGRIDPSGVGTPRGTNGGRASSDPRNTETPRGTPGPAGINRNNPDKPIAPVVNHGSGSGVDTNHPNQAAGISTLSRTHPGTNLSSDVAGQLARPSQSVSVHQGTGFVPNPSGVRTNPDTVLPRAVQGRQADPSQTMPHGHGQMPGLTQGVPGGHGGQAASAYPVQATGAYQQGAYPKQGAGTYQHGATYPMQGAGAYQQGAGTYQQGAYQQGAGTYQQGAYQHGAGAYQQGAYPMQGAGAYRQGVGTYQRQGVGAYSGQGMGGRGMGGMGGMGGMSGMGGRGMGGRGMSGSGMSGMGGRGVGGMSGMGGRGVGGMSGMGGRGMGGMSGHGMR